MNPALSLFAAAAGAALGEAMLAKKLGNRALAWGAGLALVPAALDFLASLVLRTSPWLAFQSTATHSLAAAGLAAWLLPRWLAPRWKRAKIPLPHLRFFCGLAWLAGPLLGCLTLPGTGLLWPLPLPRLSCHLLAPGDAMPALLLGGAMLALLPLRKKKEQAKRRRLWWWGLTLAASYLTIFLAAKLWLAHGFRSDLARRGTAVQRHTTLPTAWNPLLWRGLADCGDEIRLAHRSLWEWPSTPVQWTVIPRGGTDFARYSDAREPRRIAAFTDGWWLCRPNKTGLWMADLRAGENRVWGERKGMVDLRCRTAWHFEPRPGGDPLRALHPTAPPGGTSARLLRRSFAHRADWQAQPRLAGVPGALPELLGVEE